MSKTLTDYEYGSNILFLYKMIYFWLVFFYDRSNRSDLFYKANQNDKLRTVLIINPKIDKEVELGADKDSLFYESI